MGSIAVNPEDIAVAPSAIEAEKLADDGYQIPDVPFGARRKVRVVHIGFGMAGIDFAYKVRDRSDIELQCYDKNDEAGGTWLENRYPGCACDVPIALYQFQWALRPDWNTYYASGPEILKYLQDISKENDLYRFAKFRHRITSLDFQDDKGKWRLTIMRDNDPTNVFFDEADIVINGTGILNNWKWPLIQGLHNFSGPLIHSANWDDTVSLKDKRVAVIGIGSSAIQVIPSILDQTKEIFVFNRSQTWVTQGFGSKFAPKSTDLKFPEELKKRWRDDPKDYLNYAKTLEAEMGLMWNVFLRGSPEMIQANKATRKAMEEKLQHRQDLIDAIIPTTFPVGCRRPTPGTGFLEALVDPKTRLLTGAIASIDKTGINRANGEHIDVDVIICCTGFNNTFRPRFPINVRGVNMQEFIGEPAKTSYLGLATPGVPNYFVFGPYAPYIQGAGNLIMEAQNKYYLLWIDKFQTEFIKEFAPKIEAGDDFLKHSDIFVKRAVFTDPCPSWYKGGDPNGRPAIWPGGRAHSFKGIETPRYEDFDIKYVYGNRFAYFGNGQHVIELGDRDPTWYYGLLDGKDEWPNWKE